MGLFSKKHIPIKIDLDYDIRAVDKGLVRFGAEFYETRQDVGTSVFVKYTHKLLNLEILKLSTSKDLSGDSFAYQRGRVDALKDLINKREAYLADESNARAKDKSAATDHKSKRSYISRPSTAGLS
jgi:hypothetical protein